MHRRITFESERKQRGAVLRVMCLALMMVVAAVASLNVALPGIARDTGATQTQLQWIVDAYALVVRGAAAAGRRDRRPLRPQADPARSGSRCSGSRRSRRCSSTSPGALIGLRARDGRRRRVRDAGDAVGDHDGLPARGARQGRRHLGRRRRRRRRDRPARLGRPARVALVAGDLRPQRRARGARARAARSRSSRRPASRARRGSTRSARCSRWSALAALVFGIIEGPERGWSDPVDAGGARRRRSPGSSRSSSGSSAAREPMLDPRNFLRRGFGAGSLSITVQFFAAFGFLFLALPYLQLVMGFSPLEASAALLPMALVVIPLSRVAPAIAARRRRPRRPARRAAA